MLKNRDFVYKLMLFKTCKQSKEQCGKIKYFFFFGFHTDNNSGLFSTLHLLYEKQ